MRESNVKLFTLQRKMLDDNNFPIEVPFGWDSANEAVLVASNNLRERTAELLEDSAARKIPVEWSAGRYMAPINTGNYYFPFLERLDINGVKFTLEMMPLELAKLPWHQPTEANDPEVSLGEYYAKNSNLSWVTASTLYLLKIEGMDPELDFDWTMIGMKAIDSKKLTKRLQEITRLVKSATRRDLRVRVLDPHIDGTRIPVEYFDGKSVVRRSVLPKNIRNEDHIMGRGFTIVDNLNDEEVTPYETLVKGDFIAVDDESWIHGDYDIAIHVENAKSEFVMDRTGRFAPKWIGFGKKKIKINQDLWTWWPHHVLHDSGWDHQTTLSFPKVNPVSAMKADLDAQMKAIREKLDQGLFPEEVAESEIERDGAINFDAFKQDVNNSDIARYDSFANRAVAALGSVKPFVNLVFMKINGKAKSMASTLVLRDGPMKGYHERHIITRRNSFRATVVTTDFLKMFVGIDYEMNGNDLVYDDRWGMVWTGEAFRVRFNLHGGDDLDDTHGFIPIKVWGDEATVAELKRQGVLMPDVTIPTSSDEAVLMVFTDRLPVGTGEYSINRFDFSTWPEEIPFDQSLIKTVNLSFRKGWHKPQGMILPKSMTGLKAGRTYSKQRYSRADFLTDLQAQYANPNFGGVCNMLALYSHISNGGVPQCMPAMLGDIVDATQQGADLVTFKQIAGIKSLIQNEIDSMSSSGTIFVDKYTLARRASGLKVRGPRHERGLTSIERPYKQAYLDLMTDAKTKYSFYMRNSDPTVQRVRMMNFTDAEVAKALEFIEMLNNQLREVDDKTNEFTDKFNGIDDFISKIISSFEREARHEVIDNAINEIMASSNWVRTALSIWYAILKPGLMGTHGGPDRVICQMGSTQCVADIIINALAERGATMIVTTNAKANNGKIDAVKRIPLKSDRLGDTPEDIIEIAGDRLGDARFVWVMSNNTPIAVFRNNEGTFVKIDAELPEYMAW